jgi:hypothetical protein
VIVTGPLHGTNPDGPHGSNFTWEERAEGLALFHVVVANDLAIDGETIPGAEAAPAQRWTATELIVDSVDPGRVDEQLRRPPQLGGGPVDHRLDGALIDPSWLMWSPATEAGPVAVGPGDGRRRGEVKWFRMVG